MIRFASYRTIGLVLFVLWLSCALGCSTMGGGQSSAPPNPVAQSSAASPPGMSSGPAPSSSFPSPSSPPSGESSSTASGPRPIFYDFPDIPIPTELSLVSKDSYVFQSGNFKAGVLTLKGRVDLNSLISFFQMAMPRENWKPKGGFRYRRSVLIFEKPDKTCVINLYEHMFYSYAEIYVAPAGGQF